VAGKREVPRVA